eukprot:11015422-Alexandrium_andersonii.AAC.1
MSASLVGSEMCIRDRLKTAPGSSGELRAAPESLGLIHLLYVLSLKAGRARTAAEQSAPPPTSPPGATAARLASAHLL